MLIAAAERIYNLLAHTGGLAAFGVTCGQVLRLLHEVLGDDMAVYPDGRMLIWDIARHDGYRIPDYPMAGCGDVKEFLSDEGVRNVPEWYEHHLGMSRSNYDEIYRYELVMVRNRSLWRRVFAVPSSVMAQKDATEGPLLAAELSWLQFALGRQTNRDDALLFKR